jgi:hypothetical protein
VLKLENFDEAKKATRDLGLGAKTEFETAVVKKGEVLSALLTHRIDRTGRMGADGAAVTLITPEDELRWRRLRREGAPDLPRNRPQPERSFGRRTPAPLPTHGPWPSSRTVQPGETR